MSSNNSIYLCIKQFNARLGDELNLKVGDKVEVLADDSEYNDGWYMGKNLLTNEVGLYPKSFTQVLNEKSESGTLLRSRSRRLASNPNSKPTSPSNVNKLASNFEKMNVSKPQESKPSPSGHVHKTMNDIDKALEELQTDSFSDSPNLQTNNDFNHKRNPSAQSLTEDLNPLQAADWTPQQVSSYFALVLGFDLDIAGKFARHKITGAILFQLDLAHLKELEIDSFGTRFEVHKEIENLKQISSRVKKNQIKNSFSSSRINQLLNDLSTDFSEQDRSVQSSRLNNSLPNNNSDENMKPPSLSQSQLLPSVSIDASRSIKTHQRKRSQSMENIPTTASELYTPNDKSSEFMSPRKAPEPPSASPMNNNYKFGGSPKPSGSNYVTRTNAGNSLGISGLSRPASSVYENSLISDHRPNHHRRNSSVITGHSHKRHSSLFSLLSGNNEEKEKYQSHNLYHEQKDDLKSPAKLKREKPKNSSDLTSFPDEEEIDIDNTQLSPRKSKSLSRKSGSRFNLKDEKRAASDSTNAQSSSRLKNLRTVSTKNFRNLTELKKLKTSAFQEGIRDITPDDAIKAANFSGWMSKKSGNTLGWRSRYFTLHGTRLSYFASLRDKKEKGLIDITAHKVIPVNTDSDANSNDKYIALYAASTGFGRYCFKIVPPAPGFKKGLTFTQPKTHFFAVETYEEMRGWMKALMTATIDIDDSVPVLSSCSTPTVSLPKAQELLAKAREETKLKDEELRAKGFLGDDNEFSEAAMSNNYNSFFNSGNNNNESITSDEGLPIVDSLDETTVSSVQRQSTEQHPKLSIDTSSKNYKSPSTPQVSNNQAGFASPYLLASGLLSPKLGSSAGVSSPTTGTPNSNKKDYFPEYPSNKDSGSTFSGSESHSNGKSLFSNSAGRVVSGSKKKDKMLAYSSDGSGNHTFVIKSKK